MKNAILFFVILLLLTDISFGQKLKTENLVVITLDGFRWQEVFNGADSSILFNSEYVKDNLVKETLWDHDAINRRKMLMPFFWNVIGNEGQLYGNRYYDNRVSCANPYKFSYPGYSELLVGFVDQKVNSNEKRVNPNYTVLDYIHKQTGFNKSIAVFSTWEVIPYIIRDSINGIYTNCGLQQVEDDSLSERQQLLNNMQNAVRNPYGQRYDAFTFYHAFEYMKLKSPRVVLISLDETDEHGHKGHYDEYLKSARNSDKMIGELWNWIQNDPRYKNKTTLLITTDHGRGRGSDAWKQHGKILTGSGQTWFAVIGPDTPSRGEMKTKDQLFQKQLAKTMAALLGLNYENEEKVGEVVEDVFNHPFSLVQQ